MNGCAGWCVVAWAWAGVAVEALLAVPWIARVASLPAFHQWSLAEPAHGRTLMAEFDRGDRCYVVAFLESDDPIPIPLPAWHETETARRRRDAWNRGETREP